MESAARSLFVGRDRELSRLVAALDRAVTPHACMVLCDGEAGIGKTRLVDEFAGLARERGAVVLAGGCVELGQGGLPFGPFVEALRAGIAGGDLTPESLHPSTVRELGRLLPEIGPADGVTPAADEFAQSRLFEAFRAAITSISATRPCVLVLEDLHWGDRSTFGLLGFLIRNLEREPVLIIGTRRTHLNGRVDPTAQVVGELARRPVVERCEVEPFDREATAACIAGLLGHTPDPGLVDTILDRSDGNPFVIEELTAAARDGGGRSIPPTLHETILTRLASLGESAQAIAGAAAVAGRVVEESLLARLTGLPSAELAAGLRELLDGDILAPIGSPADDRFAFRHALTREVAYLDLLPADRRRLHAICADELATRPTASRDAELAATIAHHRDLAGDPVRALPAMLAAAEAAMSVFAFAAASHDLDRALDLWEQVPVDDRPPGDRAALLERASDAAGLSGDADRAGALARQALAELGDDADPARRGRLLEELADHTMFSGTADRLSVLEEAARLLASEPPSATRARALVNLGAEWSLRGEREAAIASLEESIRVADAADAPAPAAIGRTYLAGLRPETPAHEAVAIARASVKANEAHGRPQDIGYAYLDLASWLWASGRFEEALAASQEGLRSGERHGFAKALGPLMTANACEALGLLGRWTESEDAAAPSLERGGGPARAVALALAMICVARGDFRRSESLLDLALGEEIGPSQIQAWAWQARAEMAVLLGDIGSLRQIAAEAVEMTPWHTLMAIPWAATLRAAIAGEANAAADARARRDEGGIVRARELAAGYLAALESFDGEVATDLWLYHAFRATASAEATRLLGTDAPAAWQEAERRWVAIDAPYWAAYSRYRRAESALIAHAADRRSIADWLCHADRVAAELGARRLTADIRGLARRARVDLAVLDVGGDVNGATHDAIGEPAVGHGGNGNGAIANGGDPRTARVSWADGTAPGATHGLTARELEILGLLARGLTNRQIGERLFISPKTAGVHVSNILGKLGVGGRVEAATVAQRMGLVPEDVGV